MSVRKTIRNRRSIYEFKMDKIPKATITRLIETAVWAPNHKLTEPWRFIVITGKAKEALAAIYAKIQREKAKSDRPDLLVKITEKGYAKICSKPLILGIICKKDDDITRSREDYAATCCAIQNIALTAWEEGNGIQWSTGGLLRDSETLKLLKIDPKEEELIGLLYCGYPASVPVQKRTPGVDRTEWLV